jgi:uncharacterized iron-regulated protein
MTAMRTTLKGLAIAACALLASFDAPALTGALQGVEWKSEELAQHPLAGTAWDTSTARPIGWDDLVERVGRAPFAILGELHDNSDHHRIQLRLLESIVAGGRKPALAMEQLDRENQPAIDAYLAGSALDADGLADAGKLSRKGWMWDDYRPLVAFALKVGLPIVAANLSRADARAVGVEGFPFLGPGSESRLALARTWGAAQEDASRRELVSLHCGDDPGEARLTQMIRAQRARDALLADALLAHRGRGGVVITGNAHASRSMGVPRYLLAREAGTRAVSVGILEVREGHHDWRGYVQTDSPSFRDFDIVIFTPRAKRADPCERFAFPPAAVR